MTKTEAEVEAAVLSVLADEQQKGIKSYIERGRRHAHLTNLQLQDATIAAYQSWGDHPDSRRCIAVVEDLLAEYTLRNLDPPTALIEPHLAKVTAFIRADHAAMTGAERSEISGSILQRYESGRGQAN